ncbi:hypothetical protein MYXA107069_37845 [Myxococcus xanthus]
MADDGRAGGAALRVRVVADVVGATGLAGGLVAAVDLREAGLVPGIRGAHGDLLAVAGRVLRQVDALVHHGAGRAQLEVAVGVHRVLGQLDERVVTRRVHLHQRAARDDVARTTEPARAARRTARAFRHELVLGVLRFARRTDAVLVGHQMALAAHEPARARTGAVDEQTRDWTSAAVEGGVAGGVAGRPLRVVRAAQRLVVRHAHLLVGVAPGVPVDGVAVLVEDAAAVDAVAAVQLDDGRLTGNVDGPEATARTRVRVVVAPRPGVVRRAHHDEVAILQVEPLEVGRDVRRARVGDDVRVDGAVRGANLRDGVGVGRLEATEDVLAHLREPL